MSLANDQQPVAQRPLGRLARVAIAAAALLAAASVAAQEQSATRSATAQPQPAAGADDPILQTPLKDGVLQVQANRSTVLKTRVPYKNVSIAQPDVADVNLVGPRDMLLTAKKPGTTQLVIWDDDGRSQVVEVIVGTDLQALQDQVKGMFPGSRIEVTSLNGTIALRGRVPSLQVAEQAGQVAAPFGQKVLNFLEVSGGQQIMLQIRFAEISRSASTNLGFNAFLTDGTTRLGWNNGAGGSPIGGLALGDRATAVNPAVSVFGAGQIHQTTFEYFVSALRRNNLLRVLAEPNLVVYSGAQGSFLAGGEFPVPVPQTGSGSGGNSAITVEYKQFGVRLDFTPVVLGDGRIRLKVSPEVSDLDFSRSVSFNGFVIPSITKRTLTTEIELAEGQTFAVAGLLNNRVTANKDVTPLLGDVPILGALFRSVRYERNESELVVLVTPRLVEPMNPDQVPSLPGERWRYPTEGELLWNADLGGPAKDRGVAPQPARPTRFRGEYGFTPARK
jgi:pilus assembly protein CpaC